MPAKASLGKSGLINSTRSMIFSLLYEWTEAGRLKVESIRVFDTLKGSAARPAATPYHPMVHRTLFS